MDSEFEHCGSTSTNREQHFIVEDLLDFSNDDGVVFEEDGNITSSNSDSNYSNNNHLCDSNNASGGGYGLVVTPPGSGNSSSSGNNNDVVFPSGGGESGLSEANFSGELCVPYDDLAELEWLSNFVEESFSSEDLQKSHLVSGMTTSATKTRPELTGSSEARYYPAEPLRPESHQNPTFVPEMPVPGKARSKRSRAAPGNWTSRLKVLSNGPGPGPRPEKPPSKKKCGPGARSGHSELSDGEVRRCLHCATDKTPQWRTGPMGPKTLCNACGVRYKSGRLVPEYRPAASPTFVQTKHSNSHRKVMELRRQKEVMNQQQQRQQQQYIQQQQQQQQQHYHQQQQQLIRQSSMMFDPTNNPEDYLIHQHIGPDYRQLA